MFTALHYLHLLLPQVITRLGLNHCVTKKSVQKINTETIIIPVLINFYSMPNWATMRSALADLLASSCPVTAPPPAGEASLWPSLRHKGPSLRLGTARGAAMGYCSRALGRLITTILTLLYMANRTSCNKTCPHILYHYTEPQFLHWTKLWFYISEM